MSVTGPGRSWFRTDFDAPVPLLQPPVRLSTGRHPSLRVADAMSRGRSVVGRFSGAGMLGLKVAQPAWPVLVTVTFMHDAQSDLWWEERVEAPLPGARRGDSRAMLVRAQGTVRGAALLTTRRPYPRLTESRTSVAFTLQADEIDPDGLLVVEVGDLDGVDDTGALTDSAPVGVMVVRIDLAEANDGDADLRDTDDVRALAHRGVISVGELPAPAALPMLRLDHGLAVLNPLVAESGHEHRIIVAAVADRLPRSPNAGPPAAPSVASAAPSRPRRVVLRARRGVGRRLRRLRRRAGGWSRSVLPTRTAPSASTAPSPTTSPAAGTPSAGPPSAGTPSAGTPSAGTPSAGTPSAGPPSAGPPSAGPPSAGPPLAGTAPAGPPRVRLDGQAGLSAEVRNLLDGAPLDVRLTVRETELDVAVRVPAGAPALLRLGPAGQLDPGGLAGTHHVAWRLVALTSRALP